jgi:uncharacterized membrane protein
MPYCTQCGNEVAATAKFCGKCGARQADATPDYLGTMSPRTASLLCYVPFAGWIAAIIVLASERFRQDREVRFHAFQGLYLFVAWLIAEYVFSDMLRLAGPFRFGIGNLFKAVIIGAWIFMLVKISQNRTFRLPIVGELAERSVSEQR